MKNWYGGYNLFRREVFRFRKIIIDTVISPVISNLLYILVFSLAISGKKVMGVDYIVFLAPGLIAMNLIMGSFSGASYSLVMSKVNGTVIDLLIVPLTGTQIVLAYLGASIVRALVTGTLTFFVIMIFAKITIYSPLLAILAAILTSSFFGSIGIIVGYFAKYFENINMLLTFIITPMSFLGGVFYSVENLPKHWGVITLFNPMFYFIDLFRFSIIGVSHVNPIISFSIAILSNLIIIPFAILLFTKGKKLSVL